ncbi:DMT family transporter [Flavobacterium kingsejongi]|uniref:EamA family transporter n=1 Tax=Flavobacterium kingsejongi TaxID=1678728 RepID=A0A2S1LTV5_9FLAO|nr:DMT family transporter [Flavobacterium kingsejongi]AWG27081.1 EamA family transporter [Flavobacterium kingsejongi]
MPNDNLKSYLQLHLIVFIWGFTAILGALISLDALPLVWFRMSLAVVFIALYVYFKKIPLRIPLRTVVGLLIAGLVIALHWLTFFMAIKVSNVSVTLACISTGAFFTALLEPLFYKKKVIWYEVLFGVIVVIGLGIIFKVETKYIEGIALALTSAFLSASFSIINGTFAKTYNPSLISFYEIAGGVLFLSIFLLCTGGFSADFFTLTASDWGWLLLLSSICTAYAFIGSVKVMKFISPYTVMLTINLEPVYGITLAVLFFPGKEKMSFEFYIGALVILSTVIMNVIIKNYKKKAVA